MNAQTEGARAAIYTRISKDLQLEGLGVARQHKDCFALAAKYDWEVIEEKFEDNDISASGGKVRLAYDWLKAFMEAGAVDVVVVYSQTGFIETLPGVHRRYGGDRCPRRVSSILLTRRCGIPIPIASCPEWLKVNNFGYTFS
ncbi:recombinase family protein [Arthrobacter sp. Bi83]|uniref:recombinase family protein n=1 Tax=Arthrobacter sp. Bi83 TaxID=2822353 RepID=UPI001E4B0234|nr:recombinase family protein [Arthrobacter sp. Bi83]